MKINTAAFALLATNAAAVAITRWPLPTGTPVAAAPTPATTAARVQACVWPNKCGPDVNDKWATAMTTPAPAAATDAFEACVMPDGCADNYNQGVDAAELAPRAMRPPPVLKPVRPGDGARPPRPPPVLKPVRPGEGVAT